MPEPYLNLAVLLGGIAIGLVIHEMCHGLVCAYYGWPHTLLFAPPLIDGSRLRTLASGVAAACRLDTSQYFREAARRRRHVALAPLLVSGPLLLVLAVTHLPAGRPLLFLSMVTGATIPSGQDWAHAVTWHERTRTWWQVEIGEQCINHSRVEGYDCRRPW